MDKQVLSELVPSGHSIISVPRGEKRRGGGVGLVHKSGFSVRLIRSSQDKQFSQFEYMESLVSVNDYALKLCVVYCPPPSARNGMSVSAFFEEWPDYLDSLSTSPNDFIIMGDMNFHLDIQNDPHTKRFNSLLDVYGLKQHVSGVTHKKGHTLDIVISRISSESLFHDPPIILDPGLCDRNGKLAGDHFAIQFSITMGKPNRSQKNVSFCRLKNICVAAFLQDLQASMILHETNHPLDVLIQNYDSELKCILDIHAPTCNKTITMHPYTASYTDELCSANNEKRRRE